MNKKEIELWVLEEFKKKYHLFPEGKIEQSDSPDFLVHCADEVIGIELAEIFQDSHLDKGSNLKRNEITQGMFGETLLELLVSKVFKKTSFMLSIDFSNHYSFTVSEINLLVNRCSMDCMEFLWNNDSGNSRIENDGTNLPKEVNSIFIQISNYDYEPMYCNPQGGWIDTLRNEHILPTLNKHDKALKKYNKCDEYWLIIREGNYFAGSFSDIQIKIETPIETAFDKIFAYRKVLQIQLLFLYFPKGIFSNEMYRLFSISSI